MRYATLLEQFLGEQLSKIPVPTKKWYQDIFNKKLKAAYREYVEKIVEKHFKITHPDIAQDFDVEVSKPLIPIGWTILINIDDLYTKSGKKILDSSEARNPFEFPMQITVTKKPNKPIKMGWSITVAPEFRHSGIHKSLIDSVNKLAKAIKEVDKIELWVDKVDLAAVIKVPGIKVKEGRFASLVEKGYLKWARRNGKRPKDDPSKYPFAYWDSRFAPLGAVVVIDVNKV